MTSAFVRRSPEGATVLDGLNPRLRRPALRAGFGVDLASARRGWGRVAGRQARAYARPGCRWRKRLRHDRSEDEVPDCIGALRSDLPSGGEAHREDARAGAKLGDQLKRSWQSVGLNLSEADGYRRRARRNSIRIGIGSNCETKTGLGIGAAFDYVKRAEVDEVVPDLERLTAMATARLNAN